MLKEFYESATKRIKTYRSLGCLGKGNFIRSFQKGGDCLTVFRNRANSYNIHFWSVVRENSWTHHDVPLRLVVLAIKSFDGMTDMFGTPFHDEKTHTFEY